MIDVQGLRTRAEGGEQYALSYLCTALPVPKLAALHSLQAGLCSRAVVSCVMRARVIPDVLRSDQGAEMTELLALCELRHIHESADTPQQ